MHYFSNIFSSGVGNVSFKGIYYSIYLIKPMTNLPSVTECYVNNIKVLFLNICNSAHLF